MEAPTPVSALMHAGIINGGGVLLLHFAPLIVQSPLALLNLVVVGTLTAALGMLAMWAQTNVKRTLAWSTVGQMGFMMVQIGLAAFPAAILHLVGHGCYKAWAFLRTGDLPRRAAPAPKLAPGQAVLLAVIGTLAAVPALALASIITGFDPFQSPGKLALAAILALAIGQLWVACFQAPRLPSASTKARRSSLLPSSATCPRLPAPWPGSRRSFRWRSSSSWGSSTGCCRPWAARPPDGPSMSTPCTAFTSAPLPIAWSSGCGALRRGLMPGRCNAAAAGQTPVRIAHHLNLKGAACAEAG
jgi:hypothetical protein